MQSKRVASARRALLENQPILPHERLELEKSFFKSLCMPNGTHKTTAAARLKDVDELIAGYLENRKNVRLLDVGISSGVTTLELLNTLESRGIHLSGIGVDICVRAFMRSFPGVDILHDARGNVLQVATPFFARGRPHPSQKSLRSKLLGVGIDMLEAGPVKKWLANCKLSRPLYLVTQGLLERKDFEVVEHDVTVSKVAWNDSFDLIRAANMLSRAYFSPSVVAVVVKNLTSWLRQDGLLVICGTAETDGKNDGSVYRKRNAPPWLQLVHSLRQGYELDALIQEMFCNRCGESSPPAPPFLKHVHSA
jgi:hypothetical protein